MDTRLAHGSNRAAFVDLFLPVLVAGEHLVLRTSLRTTKSTRRPANSSTRKPVSAHQAMPNCRRRPALLPMQAVHHGVVGCGCAAIPPGQRGDSAVAQGVGPEGRRGVCVRRAIRVPDMGPDRRVEHAPGVWRRDETPPPTRL
jgi:hypothetical protein